MDWIVLLVLTGLTFLSWNVRNEWPHEIRDRFLLLAGGLGIVWLCLNGAAFFGCLLVINLVHWAVPNTPRSTPDHPEMIRGVLVIAAAGVVYSLFLGTKNMAVIAQTGIVATACAQVGLSIFKRVWGHMHGAGRDAAREMTSGSQAGRIYFSTVCAIALPLAPFWVWPILITGILLGESLVIVGALIVGMSVRYPGFGIYAAIPVALVGLYVRWRRGHPRDSVNTRKVVISRLYQSIWHRSWWHRMLGYGHGAMEGTLLLWFIQRITYQKFLWAHHDFGNFLYDYGFLGAMAVVVWGVSLWPYLALGDPLTGALVTVLAIGLVHSPLYQPPIVIMILALLAGIAQRGG